MFFIRTVLSLAPNLLEIIDFYIYFATIVY